MKLTMTKGLAAALVVAGLAVASAQAPPVAFELPAPTGRSPVGTTRWVVKDMTRPESFAPGKTREVEVIVWYSAAAAPAGKTAPYMRDGMEEVLSFTRLAKLGGAFDGLASVKTHAVLDAPPAASPTRFPVILFQHGYTGLPSSHTALLEDLASHGWVVLNIIHPYEATGAMLADGTVIAFLNEKGVMHQGIMEVLGEWAPEDGAMAKVTAAKTEPEQEALLRGYRASTSTASLSTAR